MKNQQKFIPGPSGQLYTFLNAPQGGLIRDSSILILNPSNDEYSRCHRPLRVLAESLAAKGYPVLRFDYFATGDSAGELEQGRLAIWQRDIECAVEHLRDLSVTNNIQVIGIRMGATLGALASSRIKPTNLILWDPVLKGSTFLQQNRIMQRDFSAFLKRDLIQLRLDGNNQGETMGFPLTNEQQREFDAIELTKEKMCARFIHVLSSDPLDEMVGLFPEHTRFHTVPSSRWGEFAHLRRNLFASDTTNLIAEIVRRPYHA